MYSNSKDSDDLSLGFHRNFTTVEQNLTKNKETEEEYHVINYTKDVFSLSEHQKKLQRV